MKIVFLDTETISKDNDDTKNEICGIAYGSNNKIVHNIFKTVKPVLLEAMSINNITPLLQKGKEYFGKSKEYIGLKKQKSNPVFVMHNAIFDISVLRNYGIEIKKHIDTLKVIRMYDLKDEMEYYNLNYTRYFLGIFEDLGTLHEAHSDIKILEKVFDILKKKFTIDEMISISSKPAVIRKMPFGKYKGMKIEELPNNYVDWLLNNAELTEDLIYNIKLKQPKQLLCSTCGAVMLRSKAGNLYCPNSLPGRGAGTPHQSKEEPSEPEKKFNQSLK